MHAIKTIVLGGVALIATLLSAQAQGVNGVAATGVVQSVIKQSTYSAVARGLVPAAAATDIFCISASASKNVLIKRIEVTGVAGTLTSVPFTLLRRATLDTGGTAATGAALPVATPNISSGTAATGSVTAYTANPTITDAAPTYFRSQWLTLPTAAAGTSIRPIYWDMSAGMDFFTQGVDLLKGSTQQYCINLNGQTVTTGTLDINIIWAETF